MDIDFSEAFQCLTGNRPFPWQEALYKAFIAGNLPSRCNLPTGLGKTSIVAIWLIARASGANVPRRLVYVVNRRTVVDQTTIEVEKLRNRLKGPDVFAGKPEHITVLKSLADKLAQTSGHASDTPLAVSTLRGQYADNREWSVDPSRPAVICGTVDMIGSRLLFSGYRIGFKSRPLHAGFLGQDVLLVHDEAHLEPAFQKLIESIKIEQIRCKEFTKFHVIELTATTRNDDGQGGSTTFTLQQEDRNHPIAKQRIEAKKQLRLTAVEDDKQVVGMIAEIAASHKDAKAAVLVFVRTLEAVATVEKELVKTKREVVLLTGTMRGQERDELVDKPEFKRFCKDRGQGETVYLVCTSAGEVGIDISADHMVCDLSTFESMAQRLGRVNRYGDRTDTRIDVVHPPPTAFDEKHPLTPARKATLALLEKLKGDASPLALSKLDAGECLAAFAPEPRVLPATDILFDAWALTSIRKPMPGRPPVKPYLHGIAEWQPAETYVAWREEVGVITQELIDRHGEDYPSELLDDYPLKPHELLRDRSDRVFKQLEALARRHAENPVWVLDARGAIQVTTLGRMVASLGQLKAKERDERLNDRTILLPPKAGGLSGGGMLDGASEHADDVNCGWFDMDGIWHPWTDEAGRRHRVRVWTDDPEYESKTADMRRVRSIELAVDDAEEDEPRRWEWYESISLEGGRTAKEPVTWNTHVDDVVERVKQIIGGLPLPPEIADVIILAAELHDHGKRRERFQITLGNCRYPDVLWAKAGKRGAWLPEPFRHEFASVLDAQADEAFSKLDDEMKDLVLHLIAAHHGRARPHFDADEAFDPEPPEGRSSDAEALAMEIPRRFARLQRKYGRWGLAYLESLLRATDWAASAAPSAYADEPEAKP